MIRTIYQKAAALLKYAPDTPATVMAEVLDCSPSTAATLRSLFNTCDGDPELMREWANEQSRVSKARRRAA